MGKTHPFRLADLGPWRWIVLILGPLVFSMGCNPITTMGFLLYPFADTKIPAECKLAAANKEVTVVILPSFGYAEVRPEFLTMDRELSERLAQQMRKRFEENRDKVTIVPHSKVRAYLSKNHNDPLLAKKEIGKHLGADYVINVEINGLGLYEKGSFSTLLRGTAEVAVTVIDVKQPEGEGTIFERHFSGQFPEDHPQAASDTSLVAFRAQFLDHVASKLSRYFAAYPIEERSFPR
jgi:hypothetical protein